MKYQGTWDKDQRAMAKQTGKSLFLIAIDTPSGRYEMSGLTTKEVAVDLFRHVQTATKEAKSE